jgi:opacity protein-like surface antigen
MGLLMRFNGSAMWCGLSVAAGLFLMSQAARADDDAGGFFVGGNVGRAPIETNNTQYQNTLEASAAGSGSLVFTKAALAKRDVAFSVDTGFMFMPYVGAEASYVRFGRVSNQLAGSYAGTDGTSESVYAATVLQSRGPVLGLLFRLPLLDNVDVNLRLADYYAHTELTSTLIAAQHTSGTTTSNSSSLLAGLGLSYTFAGHWLAKLDYLRVNQAGNDKTMKYDISMASAGVAYAF